jgi:hypothetical protein
VVDDVAVEQAVTGWVSGADGVGSGGAVDAAGRRGVVVDDEFEVIVRGWNRHLRDFTAMKLAVPPSSTVEPLHGY